MPTSYQFTIGPSYYSTGFDTDEAVLSEGGIWLNAGQDWTSVTTSGGVAFGTQSGTGGFDDSWSLIRAGFGPRVRSGGHIKKGSTAGIHEVELLLRGQQNAHTCYVYECNLAHDGSYLNVYRWPGAKGTVVGDFVQLAGTSVSSPADGDLLEAQIIGNTLTVYINSVQKISVDVSAGNGASNILSVGQPGIGFYRESGASAASQFGFKDFYAMSL